MSNKLNPLQQQLDSLANPYIADFIEFSKQYDTANESAPTSSRLLGNIELFGGLSRIGKSIEFDETSGTYRTTARELARYTTTQSVGVAVGGIGLYALGITLGPLGLLGGIGGYLLGSHVTGNLFDYIFPSS
jgi:hypothetical protein